MENKNNQVIIQSIKAKNVKIGKSYRPHFETDGSVKGMSIQDLDIKEEYEVGDYHEPTVKIIFKTEERLANSSKIARNKDSDVNQKDLPTLKKELEDLKTSYLKKAKKSFTDHLGK